MDGATIQYVAHLLAFSGDWDRGLELGERSRRLNSHHPAWYWALPLLHAYQSGDHPAVRQLIPRAMMPGQAYSMALIAACYGRMGDQDAAAKVVQELLTLAPDIAETAREQFAKWYLPDLVESLVDGLREAGVAMPRPGETGDPARDRVG